jgi:DNA repair exonuclease SbcCD nuclease subunit
LTDGVRFVHAADLHLGAPFSGVGADEARIGFELAEATFSAFDRVVEICLEREARFLVIAGDAYNSADASLRAQLHFLAGMQRLADAGIEVFWARGNHDPANGWSAGLTLPESLHVFPTDRVGRFEVVTDGQLVAAVYGRSFAQSAETQNLALGYALQAGDPLAVGVLHANVGANADYDPYAPASLDDLRAARMDYWALGHIHKQEVLANDPWIVYPGSTQGLNPKETGPHGCLVVDVNPSGEVCIDHVETAPIAWSQVGCDLSSAETVEEVHRLLTAACDTIRTDLGRPTVARLNLVGRSPVHGELARPGLLPDLVESVRREQSLGDPWVWIDRVADKTSSVLDLDAIRAGGDFSAELLRIADELSADSQALRAIVDEICEPLGAPLPGYEPGIEQREALLAARDAALDLLLAQGSERS